MGKFKLSCHVTVGAYTTIEADSLEEAIELAEERDVVIGGIHSGYCADEIWIIDEADGVPTKIEGM